MNKYSYVKKAYELLDEYISGVLNKTITSDIYIIGEVKNYLEYINSDLYYFNKESFERIVKFFSYLVINIQEEYKQFELLPFQCFALAELFGVCEKGTNIRKYKQCFLFLGKKSGKTPFSVAISLYMLMMDGQLDARIAYFSNSVEQSDTAFAFAESMIVNSQMIRSVLEMNKSRKRITLRRKGSNSYIKVMSTNKKVVNSLSITSSILDEIADFEDFEIYNKITTSTVARKNSLLLLTSTAGSSTTSLAFKLFEYGKKVVMKEVDDPSFLFLLYTLDEKDDYNDESNWLKSCPALNKITLLDNLKQQFKTAKNFPVSLHSFLTLNLNIFTNELTDWIAPSLIKELEFEFNEADFIGEDCYVSLDLSANRDLTSVSILFYRDDKFYSKTYAFRANNPNNIIRRNGETIKQWVDKGYIYQFEKETIDYNFIYDFILNLNDKYQIMELSYDDWNAKELIARLKAAYINCYNFSQTTKAFNFPCKKLEELVFEKSIYFDKNPVLNWNFHNVALYFDGNNSVKIDKKKGKEAVDMVVSLVMTLGSYYHINYDEEYLMMMGNDFDKKFNEKLNNG